MCISVHEYFYPSRCSAFRGVWNWLLTWQNNWWITKSLFRFCISIFSRQTESNKWDAGFVRGVVEAFAVVGCHTAWAGSWLSVFRDGVSVSLPRVKQSKKTAWPLKMALVRCPDWAITSYQPTLCDILQSSKMWYFSLNISKYSWLLAGN